MKSRYDTAIGAQQRQNRTYEQYGIGGVPGEESTALLSFRAKSKLSALKRHLLGFFSMTRFLVFIAFCTLVPSQLYLMNISYDV